MFDEIFTTITTNSNTLFIIGVVLMSFSLLLFTFACYQKRKSFKNGANSTGTLFKLGNNLNNVGFHRYNELVLNSDEEALTATKTEKSSPVVNYSKKNGSNRYSKLDAADNKKLLFTDDDDEDDDQNENIFIR